MSGSFGFLVKCVVYVTRFKYYNTACWLLRSPHIIGQEHHHQIVGHGGTQAEEVLSAVQMMR